MIQTYFCRPIRKHRVFTQPSLTQPDQTLSIREILSRFTRGIPMEGKVPIFSDDITVDPRRLDLTEIQAELDEIRDRANETMSTRKKQQEEIALQKQKAYEAQLIKNALEAQKAQQNDLPPQPNNE